MLVVGENAVKMMTVGGGSSSLKAKYEVSPLDGLKAALSPKGVNVSYERGYVGDASGSYNGVTTGQDLSEKRNASQLVADAVSAAKNADVVIFIGGLNKSDNQDAEGADRLQYGLPYGQDAVIEALANANPKLVVVNISGNAVAMPWVDSVPAIVQDWYIGSEAGNSLADVLTGKVNPSGKLPFTFPVAMEDGPIKTEAQYPGIPTGKNFAMFRFTEETYSEGIYVGYRWYDSKGIEPLFPFGYGLSYTSFEYGEPSANSLSMTKDGGITFTIPVTNTGKVAGAEVVQLYISDKESSIDRPEKELKGFGKIFLESGQTGIVKISIDADALSFFDAQKHEWVAENGEFNALFASSCRDVRKTLTFNLK